MRTQFETATLRAADLFANGKAYQVPPYQRNYTWGKEEWEVLWEDLTLLRDEPAHYMGPLLFQESENEIDHFFIIDGQQRLATLALLALAAIHRFETWAAEAAQEGKTHLESEDRERADIFRRRFIGEKEPTALYHRSRVSLNKIDNDFFQEMLSDRYRERRPVLSRLPRSHKRLYACYEFFSQKIEQTFSASRELAAFLEEVVLQKLLFTRILVADEANAYLIFETLNARGVELAPPDLIKNYLFSLLERQGVPQADIERLLGHWDNMLRDLGPREFVRLMRAYWSARISPVVRQERLFRHIKQHVQTRQDAQGLVEDLREKAALYLALQTPTDEFWNEWPRQDSLRFYLSLLSLFRVRQYTPLVFAMYDEITAGRFERTDLARLLRYIVVITFRYNVIGKRNPNQMETVYNRIAVALHDRKLTAWNAVRRDLQSLYLPDNEFEQSFANIAFRGQRDNRLIKYILLSLEAYKQQPGAFRFENPEILAQVNDSRITLEHILPRTLPVEGWSGYSAYEHETLSGRLGNLTLLEDSLNRRVGDQPFTVKRAHYRDSQYTLSREVATREEWPPEAIQHRQAELARDALHIWRLDF